jgi:putative tryptophan/tyrosine transport system substrate-binding protein
MLFSVQPNQFVVLAARYGIPAIHDYHMSVAVGGLMSYGTDFDDAYRIVGRSLARSSRAPTRLTCRCRGFQVLINLKAPRALGLTILARANEVIE